MRPAPASSSRATTPGLEQLYTTVPGAMTLPVTDVVIGRAVEDGVGVDEGDGRAGDAEGVCETEIVGDGVSESEFVDDGDAKRESDAVGDAVTVGEADWESERDADGGAEGEADGGGGDGEADGVGVVHAP